MSPFTPGPWKLEGHEVNALVDPENSETYVAPVCEIDDDWTVEIMQANGKLIEQAPAMFETIADVLEWMETGMVDGVHYDDASIRAQLRAQIKLVKP